MNKSNIFRAGSIKQIVLSIILFLVSMTIAYTTGKFGIKVGGGIVALIVSLFIVFYLFYRYTFGFYVLLVYCHFMFLIGTFVRLPFPMGTVVDAILILVLLAILIHKQY